MDYKALSAKIQNSMEVLTDDGDDLAKLALCGADLAKLAKLIGINATYQGNSQFEVVDGNRIKTEELELTVSITVKASDVGKFTDELETLLARFATLTNKYFFNFVASDVASDAAK